MAYKLIAVDIDDTLLNRKKQLTDATRTALITAQQKGYTVVVASGRLPYGVRPYAQALDISRYGGYYMGFNGGAVLNAEHRLIASSYLDSKYIEPVYEVLRPTNVTTMVHRGDVIYADRKVNAYTHVESDVIGLPLNPVDDIADFVDWPLHKMLLAGEPEELLEVEAALKARFGTQVDIYLSAPWFLEVMPKGVSKGTGLLKICEDAGIDPMDTIAFGDSYNDLSMIQAAGLGVAMGNAENALKQAADHIAPDCDHDGIAAVLWEYGVL